MNESRTPRTDANLKVLHPGVQPSTWYVQAEFARQLERELTAALARAEKAEAELERVRNDAERYQWLRDSMAYVAIQPHYSDLPKSQRTGWTIRLVTGNDNSMDAAIDAAIEREKKE